MWFFAPHARKRLFQRWHRKRALFCLFDDEEHESLGRARRFARRGGGHVLRGVAASTKCAPRPLEKEVSRPLFDFDAFVFQSAQKEMETLCVKTERDALEGSWSGGSERAVRGPLERKKKRLLGKEGNLPRS